MTQEGCAGPFLKAAPAGADGMNVLIVFAHPEPKSFNAALRDFAADTLTHAGHTVRISDLYGMKFDPVASPSQFPLRADPTHFRLQREQRHAAETGTLPADVAGEIGKLFWADIVIFQFPLWWGAMPAILKGWVDRVFVSGVVYGRGADSLSGRKALLSVTASPCDGYAMCAERVKAELHPVISNALRLPNLEVLEPIFFFLSATATVTEREIAYHRYAQRLAEICSSAA
jgi:NAD(P)H dehydrogenase (quinone)